MHIYVENLINGEGKRKAHKIPEATLLTLCWGKTELLFYARHCPKLYLTSSSQKPWQAGTYIVPVLPVRRVRHREVKEGALATQKGHELGFPQAGGLQSPRWPPSQDVPVPAVTWYVHACPYAHRLGFRCSVGDGDP